MFLSILDLNKNEFIKVLIGRVVISSLWGMYYNVLPVVFDFYPFGIPLEGLTFLGMGLTFSVIHTLAFIGGYYSSKMVFNK